MDNVNKVKSDPRLRKFDEKTTFWELLRYKYLTFYFFKRVCWAVFRLVLLIGISYVVLFPYISKIAGSFMSREDFVDVMVKLIPKYPTLDTYKAIINDNEYFKALFNTTTLSLLCGVAQMLTCAVVGYGLSKFKFRGRNILFFAVIFTMVIPHETLQMSLFMKFRYFDIWGIYGFIAKTFGLSTEATPAIANLLNTYWPLGILSFTGLAFKNGLYIFIMRQYFKGVPDELEEAAYVDGAGVIKTFIRTDAGYDLYVRVLVAMDRRVLYRPVLHRQDEELAAAEHRQDSGLAGYRVCGADHIRSGYPKYLRPADSGAAGHHLPLRAAYADRRRGKKRYHRLNAACHIDSPTKNGCRFAPVLFISTVNDRLFGAVL